ncbi:Gfo/Idh/MocA family protein [Jannaschia sp. W003]|uniref:Gfo/Idh/MocA family protein n=1 Tax=Jannaschia sp. W003 TaxID=2867012 RepID=UPI0021A889EE|nr:Gfo/Idh/MocA family oxidoreductase [Jannaschia sp. W003]UWQ20206.1 Gfo/Idh/MocA family oxidoreductase [Jannaschia sp. W003]
MSRTRLVLAGTGLIGARHLAHIRADPALELAAVVDPAPAVAVDVPVFPSVEAADVEADGIIVATPTATHAPVAVAAARRGWHALVEKPLAGTLRDADAIADAHARAGTHLLVGHHRRYHPAAERLHAVVASGAIGTPVAASLLWLMCKPDDYFAPAWRHGLDGSPIRQNLIHDVDLLRWLLGEVEDVAGLASNACRGTARPESGGAVLRFRGGAVATIAYADTAASPWSFEAATGENPHIPQSGEDCLFVTGTAGAVAFPSLRVFTGAADWTEAHAVRREPVPGGVPLARQLSHFADVIQGRAAPRVTGADGRANLDVVLRIEDAALADLAERPA